MFFRKVFLQDSPLRMQRIAEMLAVEGNKFFSLGLFEESALKFTEAIAFNPIDVRYSTQIVHLFIKVFVHLLYSDCSVIVPHVISFWANTSKL